MINIKESFSLEALYIAAVSYLVAYFIARYLGNYGQFSILTYLGFAAVALVTGYLMYTYTEDDMNLGRIIAGTGVVLAGYGLLDKYFHR